MVEWTLSKGILLVSFGVALIIIIAGFILSFYLGWTTDNLWAVVAVICVSGYLTSRELSNKQKPTKLDNPKKRDTKGEPT